MSTKKLTISVIIPAYNEEKYIVNTLKSLTNQTIRPTEIIVIDNNSNDKTAEIAESFNSRVVKETRQGNTYAMSRGLKEAKTDIIAATDADTIPANDWLENILKAFESSEIIALTGSAYLKDQNFISLISNKFYNLFLAVHFRFISPQLVGFNFAVKREELEKVGGIDEKFTMSCDIDLGLRLNKIGKVAYIPSVQVKPSLRRFQDNIFSTIYDYAKSYFYVVWLRRPPPVKQKPVR